MDKEIVIVVPSETAAYEVVKALRALDDEGSIKLYSSAVIEKRANGVVDVKDTRDPRGPWGTALGFSTGALIGLLAGPVGAAVGAAAGGAAGFSGDIAYSGFQGDFVQDVSARLEPGKYAVCASIWEDWTEPLDTAMHPYSNTVLRQATQDLAVAQISAETQALKDENWDAKIASIKDKARSAKADAKARHEQHMDKLGRFAALQKKSFHELFS